MPRDRQPTIVESRQAETEVGPDSINRSLRGVEISNILDGFAETGDLNPEDRLRISGMLERASWGGVFMDLKQGDKVLTLLTPGPKFLSIKYLNDEIFGESITTEIIIERRKIVQELIAVANENIGEQYRISPLESNYKIEAMRIPGSSQIDEGVIGQIMQAVDARMTAYIQKILAEIESGKRAVQADAGTLKNFKDALEGRSEHSHGKGGFKMNYGLATVEVEDNDGKIGALAKALQAGRIARGKQHGEAEGTYGGRYEQQEVLRELTEITKLRDEIINDAGHNNTISDRDGNEFTVFERVGDSGTWKFNRDLLREIRKEKFKVDPDAQKFLEKIILYTKKINIIDMVKPFVYEEVNAVEAAVVEAHRLKDALKDNEALPKDEREKIVKMLRSDERAEGFTSKIEFDRRAVEMNDAVYISMDVLDLGVDLLLEFEASLQEIEQEKDTNEKVRKFHPLSLYAGDESTNRLRAFWQAVKDVLEERSLQGADSLFTAHVKGDEVVLAVEMGDGEGKIKKEDIGDLLFALKKVTNSRVIETRISEAEKHTHATDQTKKVEAHLKAIKRSEFGVAILKDVEEIARKMEWLLKKDGGAETVEAQVRDMNNIFIIDHDKKKVQTNVVVVQSGDEFNVVKGKGQSVKYKDLKPKLDSILGRK